MTIRVDLVSAAMVEGGNLRTEFDPIGGGTVCADNDRKEYWLAAAMLASRLARFGLLGGLSENGLLELCCTGRRCDQYISRLEYSRIRKRCIRARCGMLEADVSHA